MVTVDRLATKYSMGEQSKRKYSGLETSGEALESLRGYLYFTWSVKITENGNKLSYSEYTNFCESFSAAIRINSIDIRADSR